MAHLARQAWLSPGARIRESPPVYSFCLRSIQLSLGSLEPLFNASTRDQWETSRLVIELLTHSRRQSWIYSGKRMMQPDGFSKSIQHSGCQRIFLQSNRFPPSRSNSFLENHDFPAFLTVSDGFLKNPQFPASLNSEVQKVAARSSS